MTLRPLAAALLAVAAIGVAACGDDAETPAASASSEEDQRRQAQVKFAECMREHGVDVPDPKGSTDGPVRITSDGDVSPEEFEEADKACEKYRAALRPNLSEEEQAEFKERALEHARCMREQGIDFPDPTFSAEGGAQVRIAPGGRVNPEDPEFQAAQEKCGDLMGGGRP